MSTEIQDLDKEVHASIQNDWKVIQLLCQSSHRQYQVPGGPFVNETTIDEFYNLPFILAYALLDQVLSVFIEIGIFPPPSGKPPKKGWTIGPKMETAKNHLHWQNYDLIWKGKEARDNLAHRAVLLNKKESFLYIYALEKEFSAWKLL